MLTAEKSRAIFRDVETVIVDEIHAVADANVALIGAFAGAAGGADASVHWSALASPTRSRSTRGPPPDRRWPASPVIVNIGHKRQFDLAVEVPGSPLGAIATNEMWDEIYNRLVELVEQHRSTLVFVNTRRLSERVSPILANVWARRMLPPTTAAFLATCAWRRRKSSKKAR